MPTLDYTERAERAYFRRFDSYADQPGSITLQEHNGFSYVVLENSYRTLAVYRIQKNDRLKFLKRWPRQLASEP
jgi:hypothetical protein